MNYRLYAFVANHYLSPLQCGLQTAHVVSELSMGYANGSPQHRAYADWANTDKTIIICGAGNHKGIIDCFTELSIFADILGLPRAIFHEDQDSMNGMATACGVIVPKHLWDVSLVKPDPNGVSSILREGYWETNQDQNYELYAMSSDRGMFISHIKSFRLA